MYFRVNAYFDRRKGHRSLLRYCFLILINLLAARGILSCQKENEALLILNHCCHLHMTFITTASRLWPQPNATSSLEDIPSSSSDITTLENHSKKCHFFSNFESIFDLKVRHFLMILRCCEDEKLRLSCQIKHEKGPVSFLLLQWLVNVKAATTQQGTVQTFVLVGCYPYIKHRYDNVLPRVFDVNSLDVKVNNGLLGHSISL